MSERQTKRQILLNAFDMNCVAHQSPGLWRHPDDHARDYNTIDYWVDLAKTLEKGLFDGLFIADVLGTYDVYGASNEATLRAGTQVPVNDPILLVSAMAQATEHLGFGITAGTAYEHPYPFARRLATIDHLTNGRVGWNVVTGYLPSAAQNLGDTDQLPHDERYDRADEYLEVVYKLLEGSWEDDAVQYDKASGVFTNPDKVHPINHHGKYFDVPGIAITEPSTQRTPVIYQAGSSPRGLRFAGENAEAVFINSNTPAAMKKTVAKIRSAAKAAGRDPHSIKVFAMQTIITAATEDEAVAKLKEYQTYTDAVGGLTLMSGWSGVDLSKYDLDAPITNIESNAIQSTAATISSGTGADDGAWTVRKLGEWTGIGGFGPILVGSGKQVAEQLAQLQDDTDVDGFNLAYAITPGTFTDIVDYVVPELQKLGRYKTEYTLGSLRHKLFGAGDRLPDDHRGASYRLGAPGSTTGTSRPKNIDEVLTDLEPVFAEIAATAAERESDRNFDLSLIQKLKDAGFTRLRVPKEYGGLGFSLSDAFRVYVALASADSNIAQGLRPHFLAVESLLAAQDERLKRRWLRRVGTGEVAIGNALTEVNNAPGEVTTTLSKLDDGNFVLNGTKFYSTGSLYGDAIYVRARISDTDEDVFVFVDRWAEGVSLLDDWDGFGQQLSASGTTVFDQVVVPAQDVLHRNYLAPGVSQALAQAHHLATLAGIGGAIEQDITGYVRGRRRSFSHGNATLPREDVQVQQVVGEIAGKAYAARTVLEGFIREFDAAYAQLESAGDGQRDQIYADIEISSFKAQLAIAPLILDAATQAFEVGGASATLKTLGLDRHWRNARVLANHNPLIYRARLIGDDALNDRHQAIQYTVGSASA